MSEKWYPVINYETCSDCEACFKKCSHGVFKTDGKKTVVVYKEGCIDGCRGCQKLCPTKSIEYVGDETKAKNCSCDCSSNSCC